MAGLIRIDEDVLTESDFVKSLRLAGRFQGLLDDIVKTKVGAIAARRGGIETPEEEVQRRANDLRRVMGLHRAADMATYLDTNHLAIEDFQTFVVEMLLNEKQAAKLTHDAAVEAYFKLNSPQFDSVELAQIVMTSEGAAREVMSIIEEDPSLFQSLAAEHSIAETASKGGGMGKVTRGSLIPELETKVFNAEVNSPIGPIPGSDGSVFEIFIVLAKHAATLDTATRRTIQQKIFDEWIASAIKELSIELV